jgi:RNA polymerase sigma-70 factor (ECF subfamily)
VAQPEAHAAWPEKDWLAAARTGDQAALGRLLEGYRQYLLLVANQELPDDLRPKAAASDLVQETFLRAHRNFGSFQGDNGDELRAWLRCILVHSLANLERDFRSTGKRELAREVPEERLFPDGLAGCLASPSHAPSAELAARESDDDLQRALAQLPEAAQQVIEWRNYDVLPFDEIGRRLGKSAEAARKLWHRALGQLGKLLEP